jgi:thiosulfate dehydrogenase
VSGDGSQPGAASYLLIAGVLIGLLIVADPVTRLGPATSAPAAQTPVPAAPNGGPPVAAPDQVGPADSASAQQPASVARGLAIANNTPAYAQEYVGNALSCSSCHLDAGRRGNAWPWLGVAQQYPRSDPRSGRQITLADRLRECFQRSENGTAPPDGDPVLQSLLDYIGSLAGTTTSHPQATQYQDQIPEASRIPIDQLQPAVGRSLYAQRCAGCHGANGEGIGDITPLWGLRAYNDGAGAARVYVLAGFIRAAMPDDAPGTLTDAEAQQIAAFVNSQPRPAFAGLAQDWPSGNIPVDAVYDTRRYPVNPLAR